MYHDGLPLCSLCPALVPHCPPLSLAVSTVVLPSHPCPRSHFLGSLDHLGHLSPVSTLSTPVAQVCPAPSVAARSLTKVGLQVGGAGGGRLDAFAKDLCTLGDGENMTDALHAKSVHAPVTTSHHHCPHG